LKPPDRRVVSYANIPCAMHGLAFHCLKRRINPALTANVEYLSGVEGTKDGGVEAAKIFLFELRVAYVFAIQRHIFSAGVVNLLLRQRACIGDRQTLREPLRVIGSHIKKVFEVVATARR